MGFTQKILDLGALTLIVILQINYCTSQIIVLENPEVTDFGDLGDIDACPGSGLFVTGMELKSQPIVEGEDNVALTGIAFFCNSPLCGIGDSPTQNQPTSTTLTSRVGHWGTWGSIFMCPDYGYVVGFQMRSQEYQTPARDDTASNNLRIVCNDGSGMLRVYEGDGQTLGNWTEPRLCPKGMAITAMATRVEDDEADDQTAVNRLFAFCTNAPFPC